jgi:aminoglycoside phosphotransferase (APT) family kinase protein
MLPPQVIHLLQVAFPSQRIGDLAATTGGFSNITASATIGERRCAIKAATSALKRADVRREAQMLELLRDSGLPAPVLLALAEDDGWTVAVTRFVAGVHGLQVLERAPAELEPLYHALGQLLSTVHQTPVAADPKLLIAQRTDHVLRTIPALELDADLSAALAASLAHPIWRPEAGCLVHGDAGLHNLLWDGRITALLDWEWAGWGTPLLDLAWLYWTMRWRSLPEQRWQTLLAGYGDGPARAYGGSPEELRALVLGQIAGILLRVQQQPSAKQEWLRRLRWTLGLVFPAM